MHYQEIFEAVKRSDIKTTISMVESDRELLNVVDSRVITPLTIAFAYGHHEIAFALIERGANVFAMNHSSKWGMRYITEKDGLSDADRIRFIEAVIATGVCDYQIFHAVWKRDVAEAKSILERQPDQVSVRLADSSDESGFYNVLPYCGLTPLHYAVIASDEAMVQCLLSAGAEVDAIPHGHEKDSRHTPLYMVPEESDSIAELLIDHGADVNHTSLYLSGGSETMRRVVIAKGGGGTPLMAALTICDSKRAAEIINADASVIQDRIPDSRIDTPLHMAVKANCPEIVDLLIEKGMDIDTQTSRGFTALAMSSEMYCSLEMIQLLVEHGADVHAGKDSAIFGAVWQHAHGHWDYESVIRYLADKGSRPRGLWHCAAAGNLKAAELLIELGADVNETDEMSFYKKLPNAGGFTALDYCTGVAGKDKHPAIEALLRQHGAKHKSEINSQV